MTIIVLEKVPVALRGELTRWLLEIASGIFVGTISALVRDLLWEKVTSKSKKGRCIQVFRTNNEQGFALRMHGDSKRSLLDCEGLTLVAVKNAAWENWLEEQRARDERLLRYAKGVSDAATGTLTTEPTIIELE
jgi:CRISPR-associated protein Cas2